MSDCLPQLLQLQDGLSTCNLLSAIQNQPQIWEPVFVASETYQMKADDFLDQLVPQYSMSQELRSKEVDTFKYFSDVIQKIGAGTVQVCFQ